MKYVFDFDRVLFDTDRFASDLKSAGIYDDSTPRNIALLDATEAAGLEVSDYVFPGAREFLEKHGSESAIVSSFVSRNELNNGHEVNGLSEFQLEKIKRSGLGELIDEKIEIVGEHKQAGLQKFYQEGVIFVDDEPSNLQVAKEIGYKTIWMPTPKQLFQNSPEKPVNIKELSKEHVVASSFEEFINLVESWEHENQ